MNPNGLSLTDRASRHRPRPAPHHRDASRVPLPPRLGHRALLPRVDLRLARLHHNAARVERDRGHPLRLLCLQLVLRLRPQLAHVAALQHVFRALPNGYLERVLARLFGHRSGGQALWQGAGVGALGYPGDLRTRRLCALHAYDGATQEGPERVGAEEDAVRAWMTRL